MQDVSAVTGRN